MEGEIRGEAHALIDSVKLPLEFRRRQTVDLVGWDSDPSVTVR